MHIWVRTFSEKIWKCIRNVSVFINVSEKCHLSISKTVRTQSEISHLTDFWHLYTNLVIHLGCGVTLFGLFSDCLMWLTVLWQNSDKYPTVFQINLWQFSDSLIKSDTFLMLFQIFSYRFLTDICIWQFSDRYWTHFWLCSDCFL